MADVPADGQDKEVVVEEETAGARPTINEEIQDNQRQTLKEKKSQLMSRTRRNSTSGKYLVC